VAGFATWLAAQRARRVLLIAALFPLPLLGLVSAAVIVMAVQVHGWRETLFDCVLALVVLAGLGFVAGMDMPVLLAGAVISWAIWLLLGTVLATTGSLILAVQAAVVMTLAAALALVVLVADPAAYWEQVLIELYAQLPQQDFGAAIDIEQQARLMSGVVLAGTLTGGIIALLLGSSLASRIRAGDHAGQFAGLRMGYVIGGLAALAGVAALVGWGPDGLLLIFGAAFMFHGIAVLAWWARQRGWPRGWWIGLCILPILLPDFLVIAVTLFAAIGFIDNWFDLRRVPQSPV
jgi:hypothetical protein